MPRLVSADNKTVIETENPSDVVQLKAQGFVEKGKPGPKPEQPAQSGKSNK